MKMTKIMKEYIEDLVSKKYDPVYKSIDNKYKIIQDRYNTAVESAKEEIDAVWRTHLKSFYTDKDLEYIISTHPATPPYSYRVEMDWRKERDNLIAKIDQDKKTAIRNIVISLELGGNKEDLDRMLAEINPTFSETEGNT